MMAGRRATRGHQHRQKQDERDGSDAWRFGSGRRSNRPMTAVRQDCRFRTHFVNGRAMRERPAVSFAGASQLSNSASPLTFVSATAYFCCVCGPISPAPRASRVSAFSVLPRKTPRSVAGVDIAMRSAHQQPWQIPIPAGATRYRVTSTVHYVMGALQLLMQPAGDVSRAE